MTVRHFGSVARTGHAGTLSFRLTFLIVTAVVAVLGTSMLVDHHFAYRRQLNSTLVSLKEQARTLAAARSRITDPAEFADYVDDFCAQMNEHISPGHHILVLDDQGNVTARSRRHSGADVERALLTPRLQDRILLVDGHNLVDARLKNKDGTTIIVAQYLDPMEGILKARLISRSLTTAMTALIIILLIYVGIEVWVIKPVNGLASAARKWAHRDFSARSIRPGLTEFGLLADEFNSMAEQLEKHENDRVAELEQARHVQAKLLPAKEPGISGLRIAAEYRQAQHVGGDLYDVFNLAQSRTCIAVLDVCGHGISAALLTGVVKMSLHRRLAEQDDLSKAMSLVNDDLLACAPEGRFVTACVGIWNQEDQSWTYCAAEHPGGLLLTANHAEPLESTAPLLGVLTGTDWPTKIIRLSPGDRVFLYTDGVVESGLTDGHVANYDLQNVLENSLDLDLAEQVSTIMAGTIRRSRGQITDDATIIGFEILPKSAS